MPIEGRQRESRKQSSSRSAMSLIDMLRVRAAASSRASGIPSRRTQMVAIGPTVVRSEPVPGTVAGGSLGKKGHRLAREEVIDREDHVLGRGPTATERGRSLRLRPREGALLVARTRRDATERRSSGDQGGDGPEQVLAVVENDEAPAFRQVVLDCVQQVALRAARRSPYWPPARGRRDHHSGGPPVRTTRPGRTNPEPSQAARTASRVLPVPPAPVSVTNLDFSSREVMSSSSAGRGMKVVSSRGRLLVRRPATR